MLPLNGHELEDNTKNTLNAMIDFAIGNSGNDIDSIADNDSKSVEAKTSPGYIKIVGMGAGDYEGMTIKAVKAIEAADKIVGYTKYIELIHDIFSGKETYATGMMQEVQRCQSALDMALSGENIVIVCSGDAGVYGMAGLVIELTEEDSRVYMYMQQLRLP